ncbi:MAG: CDP-alcohol phosphatidyltransferase family protein [Bacteroidetes bacterium]|nr:CDP-alcohol phosphatidyltransferase family protein [Bacteroidota bacterium]
MKKIIAQIPNFITCLNIVMGTLAVFFAIDGHLIWAGIFICGASILDFLDGFAARLLKAYSTIGEQLDSLADIVSFGVAPGAILFTLLEFSLFGKNQPIYEIGANWYEWMILFSAFLIPVFGAIRLARFNANPVDEPFFRGLPIPANGLFWASLGLMLELPRYQELLQLLYSTENLVIMGVFMSGMMVITMPMFSLKPKSFGVRENWYRYLFLALSIVLLIAFNVYGIALIVFLFILMNLAFYLLKVKY